MANYNQFFISKLRENPDLWDWKCMSLNKNITWDIVSKNPDLPWDWSALSKNNNITWDIIKSNIKSPWDWQCISWKGYITVEIVEEYSDLRWNWRSLSWNDNLVNNEDVVIKHLDKNWSFYEKLSTIYYSDRVYESSMDKSWNWKIISANPKLSIDFICLHLDDKPWDWTRLSERNDLTWDIIAYHLDKPWDWSKFCSQTITWDHMSQHLDKNWNWYGISRFRPLTLDILNKPLPFDIFGLSCNKSLTLDMILAHPTWKWSMKNISENPMPNQELKFESAKIIQVWWKNIIYKPNSKYVQNIIKPRFQQNAANSNKMPQS